MTTPAGCRLGISGGATQQSYPMSVISNVVLDGGGEPYTPLFVQN